MKELNIYAGYQHKFEGIDQQGRFVFLRQLLHGEGKDIELTDEQVASYMKELDELTMQAKIVEEPMFIEVVEK